jgi:hypothetical protein
MKCENILFIRVRMSITFMLSSELSWANLFQYVIQVRIVQQ